MGHLIERMEELLGVDEVARYLGVGEVTVYRWCREGSLSCLKIGRRWRIRRGALGDFVRRRERSETLTERISSFLEVSDNVMAIAQNSNLMHRMDAAFLRAGETRDGMLVKYHREVEGMPKTEELKVELLRNGLEVGRLEDEGRLRFIAEDEEFCGRTGEIERLLAEGDGRPMWVDFNWEQDLGLEAALRQQRALGDLIEDHRLVIKTTLLEGTLDEWPGATQRRAQAMHAGTMWLSESGLALSRMIPSPVN